MKDCVRAIKYLYLHLRMARVASHSRLSARQQRGHTAIGEAQRLRRASIRIFSSGGRDQRFEDLLEALTSSEEGPR